MLVIVRVVEGDELGAYVGACALGELLRLRDGDALSELTR